MACVVVAGAGGGVVAALAGSGQSTQPAAHADGLPHTTVQASTTPSQCGEGWHTGRPGTQVFDVHSMTDQAVDVYLADSKDRLLAEVDGLGPNTTRPIEVDLGKGTYHFQCLQEDTDAVTGPSVTVASGPAHGSPAVAPVNQHQLIPLALAYQKWVANGFGDVVDKVGVLQDAVDSGDLPAARDAWLPAHEAYQKLGGAYGDFGDLGDAVDSTDAGLPGGVHDKDFTGFHRVEYGLWHGQSASELKGPTDQLAKDVAALRKQWSTTSMDPLDLGLRAHEITEDSLQLDLTGESDFGSGTSLATARAGLDGTAELLDVLHPLLATRDSGLPLIDSKLRTAEQDLDATRDHGAWRAPGALSRTERERINADFGDLAEQLAPVAVIFDVRRTQ